MAEGNITINDLSQVALRKLEKVFSDAVRGASISTGGSSSRSSSNSSGSNSSDTRATRENQHAQEEAAEAANDLSDAMSGVNRAYRTQERGLRANYTALESLSNGYGRTVKAQSQSLSGLIEHTRGSNEAHDAMIEKLFKTSSHLKIMNKYLSSTAFSARELEEAQAQAAKSVMMMEDAMKHHGGKIANLIDGLAEIKKQNTRALTIQEQNLLASAEQAGLVGKSNAAYKQHINGVRSDILALQQTAQAHLKMQERISWVHEKFGALGKVITGSLTPLGMFNAGIMLAVSAISGAWDQFKIIADSGMVREWGSIKKAQLGLGISFENATKIFQENARIVGSVGGAKFGEALKTSQENLVRYGIGLEDATAATADFAANAAKSGINIKDSAKLNKSIKQQSDAFVKMRATSGVSISEFKTMNAEMISNSAVQETLNGLNQEERASKIDQMMKLRQSFIGMGMSAQTAQKAMMSMQDIGKQKVSDRFEQAAKIQQAAAIAGLSNGQQLADIYRKGKRASAAEQKILQEGAGDMAKSMDQMSMGSYGLENVANMLEENLQGPFAQLLDAGREQKIGADAIGKMSDQQTEMLKESARLNDLTFNAMIKEGQIKQIMADPIVRAVTGIVIAIAGLGLMITKGIIGTSARVIAEKTTSILDFLRSKMAASSASIEAPTRSRSSRARAHALANQSRSTRVDHFPSIEPRSIGGNQGSFGGSANMTPGERLASRRGRFAQTRVEAAAAGPTDSEIRQAHAINNARNLTARSHSVPAVVAHSSRLGKLAGGASKVLGVGAKVIGKTLLGGLTMGILPAIMGAMENMMDTENILGMDTTQGASASIGQKLIVGLMGILKGVTFGLFDGWIDDATRWLAGPDMMAKITDTIGSLKDGLVHGWIQTKGAFAKIYKWGQIANDDVKSHMASLANNFVFIFEMMGQGINNIMASIIGAVSSIVNSPMIKKFLPDSFISMIQEGKDFADKRAADGSKTIDDTVKVQELIQKDLAKNHDDEYAKIDANTKDEIAVYDAKQKASKVEATNAAKVQNIAKETTKNAEATSTAAATVSEKLIKSSAEFLGLSSNIASGQEIMAQGVSEVTAATTSVAETIAPGNGVKSSIINTPVTDTTIDKKEDPAKSLLEQLVSLNKTASDTFETEKQQLILLQALVEVNEKASLLVKEKTMTLNDMRAPTLSRAQYFQKQ